jgi:hypothetical protein
VTGADAQAAGLGNKKKLTELELCWTDSDQEAQSNNHNEVLEGLKPHDRLKVLRINRFWSSTFPAWMSALSGMVKLVLFGCKELKKLPGLWQQLPNLQILYLQELESFHCLCSGSTPSIIFPELKVLILKEMAKFEVWWETHEVREELMFPKVEELLIWKCKSLTALPKAATVISGVGTKCCSAFPALRKMRLGYLTMFERWEADEGISSKEVTFPRLEELSVLGCDSLSALPNGSLLVKPSFGGAKSVCRRSAFPALRKLELSRLSTLERLRAVEGTLEEAVAFPRLEELLILSCGRLSALPKGFPALRKLEFVWFVGP